MVADASTSPSSTLAAVAEAVDRAAGASLSGRSDNALLADLALVQQLRNQLDAMAGDIARAAELGPVQRSGSRKADIWVGANTSEQPARVRADLRRSKWLLDFAEFAVAHTDGLLSAAHVDELRKADRAETHLSLLNDQSDLVKAAQTCTFTDFKVVVQYWINAADPDGRLVDEQERSNEVNLRRFSDGTVSLNARLDAVLGTQLYEAIVNRADRIAEQLDTPQSLEMAHRYGNVRKRRAHTLAQLVSDGHHAGSTDAAPLLNIVMSELVRDDLVAGRTPHLDPFRCRRSPRVHRRHAAAPLPRRPADRVSRHAPHRSQHVVQGNRCLGQSLIVSPVDERRLTRRNPRPLCRSRLRCSRPLDARRSPGPPLKGRTHLPRQLRPSMWAQ